jgi:hypothetical protein
MYVIMKPSSSHGRSMAVHHKVSTNLAWDMSPFSRAFHTARSVVVFKQAQLFLECEMISSYTTHRVRHWCTSWENHPSELHIYNWSENSSSESEGKMAETEELLDVSSSPFLLFLSARSTRSWQEVCRNVLLQTLLCD